MGVLLAFMKSYGPKGESSSLRPDVIAPIVKYPLDFLLTLFDEIRLGLHNRLKMITYP